MPAAVQGPPEIRFEQVTKVFDDGTQAVKQLSLDVEAGTTTVLVGLSGCGKTTLLRMVNRLVTPSSGRVLIGGEDVATTNPVQLRRRIGYVMQNSGLLPHKRVIDNIATVPRLLGTAKAPAREHAMELLERVGLSPEFAQRYPGQLSGGQAQRVGVARALAADPQVLLMDEPFGAVDPIVRAELQADLIRLQAELGKTVLFVTHDIGEAFALGKHIVLLDTGATIVQQGAPMDFVARPANDFVARFIGLTSGSSSLHITDIDGQQIVVDAQGRPLGTLDHHHLDHHDSPADQSVEPSPPARADTGDGHGASS